MKLHYNTFVLLFLIPFFALANGGPFKGKYTKEKTLKKEYNVSPNAMLKIDNSYGNLDVVTWAENRTVIEVTIKTNGDNEEKVQKRLDEISVEFSGSNSLVSAKTVFDKNKGSWNFWGKNNNVSMEINYTIKLPFTNSVDLSNDYGAINLNKLQGNAKINCDYGQLIIGELMGSDNDLNFDYTDKSTIAFMKQGRINADYSGFTLEKADRVDLNADYTNAELQHVKILNYTGDYGKLTVQKADEASVRGDYVNYRFGTLSGSLDVKADYGSLAIDRLSNGMRNVTIKTNYTGIKIGYDPALAFDFKVKVNYGDMKGEEAFNVNVSETSGISKNYEGFHKSKGSGASIAISSNYGSIAFHKN